MLLRREGWRSVCHIMVDEELTQRWVSFCKYHHRDVGDPNMPVNQEYPLNLDRPEIYAFLEDSAQPVFTDAMPTKTGYTQSSVASKQVGFFQSKLFWGIDEYYDVVEGEDLTAHPPNRGVVVGNFDIIVPQAQPVSISVIGVLLIQNGVSAQQKSTIEATFQAYSPADGDPVDYAISKMQTDPTIKSGMFLVLYTCSIQKTTAQPTEHKDELDVLLGLYSGSGVTGGVHPGPGGNPPWWQFRRGSRQLF